MRDAARELDDLEAARHFTSRIGEHLAMLGGDEGGEFVGMLFDKVAKLEHHVRAGLRWRHGPFGKGLAGGFRRGVDRAASPMQTFRAS